MSELMTHKPNSLRVGKCPDQRGFTFVELLVVIFTVAVLAALLVPAMASSSLDSAAVKCMSNMRQVSVAWQMYADENRSIFAYNEEGGNPPAWVYGEEDYAGGANNYNTNYVLNPQYAQLGPYAKTATIFRCPSDPSLSSGTHGVPRIRSISMNSAVGLNSGGVPGGQGAWLPSSYGNDGVPGGPYLCYFREQDLGNPSPARLILVLEEDPDSINDGSFAFEMPTTASATVWIDIPAKYHADACNFSFVDGHVELHPWQMPQSIPNVNLGDFVSPPAIHSNPDVWWVGTHSSALVSGKPNPFPVVN
ncbi:MAG TPA: prepilin-type N-terminal cleavage/methylation domain-containing protein [Candidatus Cybelea sp.]|jgi:prepilin-type processing-associated H-X9-DG protein/prepilin-type N-terminal cleavage/methylation domain-containing protein|nr:prepilin-type N-terminal cleavage/methylation domain-containing protein [Candidatus Cybelea sp.]